MSQSDMDADGDGKLLVVLDLQADTALSQVLLCQLLRQLHGQQPERCSLASAMGADV